MKVGTEVEIAVAHRLMDYIGKCARLHGHNYRIIVEVDAELDPERPEYFLTKTGILIDFAELKSHINLLLNPLDHSVMLRQDDPLVSQILLVPNQLVNIFAWNPTAENFALWIKDQLSTTALLAGYDINVRVYETSKSYAEV